MAYWDSEYEEIVIFPPIPSLQYPGWEEIDCGCCNGIEWGGMEPRECGRCEGSGAIFHHIKSGVFAQYPGGPFVRLKEEK